MKKVHLLVEKYNQKRQELLLDFVREDEFIYFRQNGDYLPTMHLSTKQYEPSMVMVYGCAPERKIWEGSIITLGMNRFMEFRASEKSEGNDEFVGKAATVFLEVQNGEKFASLIDDEGSSVSGYVPLQYRTQLASSWQGAPCALEYLEESFDVMAWNVGQGNTNSISDGTNLTIFDFGASMYYPKKKLEGILDTHKDYIKRHGTISLIISHWDIDHYNLLCVVSDEFLQKLCCVFYPSKGIGLTMMQVAKRIEKNCRYRIGIEPAGKTSRKCGIKKIFEGNRYTLFTGEKSKDKNRSGLLLSVHNQKSITFLTADHSNYQVWGKMYEETNAKEYELHVIVPHHGGRGGKPHVQAGNTKSMAVISVGHNNYGHPKDRTVAEYKAKGYTVMRTDCYGYDVIVKNWTY